MTSLETIILFVCEHGAAKSIIAATYFNQLAAESGLKLQATARGTNPDHELSEQTVQGLERDGLSPIATTPQQLTPNDLLFAERIVSFCPLPTDDARTTILEQWDGIPQVSENYERARDAILERIHDLLNRLRRSS